MKIIATCILFLVCILPVSATAEESVNDLAAKGSEAFVRGDFDAAHELYAKALAKEPSKAALLYNQANVLYRQEKYEEALGMYAKAVSSGPPRKLLSNIFFNSGNTALQLANLQTAETEETAGTAETTEKAENQGADQLKKALSYYEQAFEMYRNSLENARAVSIAEGRDVKSAGLYARQNWALARKSWTETWEKIRELERKNLQLEDGVASLLQAQQALLPNLERTYLNSLSDDILNFNLKKLAEYQLDYHADITNLIDIATKEEEKLQADLDNLKAAQPAPGQSTAGNPPAASPDQAQELTEIEERLKIAGEINKAVQQVASLAEWIVDGLKRGEPIQTWQKSRQSIDLLQGLEGYLNKSDLGLVGYQKLVMELQQTENLLGQVKSMAALETGDNDNGKMVKAAIAKRTTLAQAKSGVAVAGVAKLNLLLEQIKDSQQDGDLSTGDQGDHADDYSGGQNPAQQPTGSPESEPDQATTAEFMQTVLKQLVTVNIGELLKQNETLIQELQTNDFSSAGDSPHSVSEQLSQARRAFLWYQHLGLPITQIISTRIKDIEAVEERVENSLESKEKHVSPGAEFQVGVSPQKEEIDILLFQLEHVLRLLQEPNETSLKKATGDETSQVTLQLQKSIKSLQTSWAQFEKSRDLTTTAAQKKDLVLASVTLRKALFQNLLVFSPETAIALFYERTKAVHEKLVALLPVRADATAQLAQHSGQTRTEATGLKQLLDSYFASLEEAISKLETEEKKEAYGSAIPARRKSVDFIQRFIDEGRDATTLAKENKLQQAEILYRDMAQSIDKSRMAFSEQPKEGEALLSLAIEQQKRLEIQSRAANEAISIEGKAKRLIPYASANQEDIKALTDRAKTAIEQKIGMAEVPTHGGGAINLKQAESSRWIRLNFKKPLTKQVKPK